MYSESKEKIKSFRDLFAWKEAHALVLLIYKVTKTFPRDEIFVLCAQIRRCAISISSNLAEGFTRKTKKDKVQFYHISLGSLSELQNQLLISHDLNYISKEECDYIENQAEKVSKLVNGLVKSATDHT